MTRRRIQITILALAPLVLAGALALLWPGPRSAPPASRPAPSQPAGEGAAGEGARAAGAVIKVPNAAAPRAPRPAVERSSTPADGGASPAESAGRDNPDSAGDQVEAPARAPSVRGEVRTPEGQPLEGVALRLRRPEKMPASAGPVEAQARSDRSGRFEFRPLPPGRWLLSARADDRLSVLARPVDLPAAEPIALVLEPDRPARVRVVDAGGLPLPGVRLSARATPRAVLGATARAVTRADGQAELRELPQDSGALLEVTAEVLQRPTVRLERTAGELRAGLLEIVMGTGGEIEGVVKSPSGEPLRDVHLVLASDAPAKTPRTLYSTSTGAFRFVGLPDGEYTLFADGGERGRRLLPGLRVDGGRGQAELRVELAPAGTPEAEEAEPPRATTTVRALRRNPDRTPGRPDSPGTGTGATGTVVARLDAEAAREVVVGLVSEGAAGGEPERLYHPGSRRGELRLPGVPPGTYEVILLVEGRERARAGGVRVAAGRETAPVEFKLEN